MTHTLDTLPFDPAYAGRADLLHGIEKVRAFEDPDMRRTVFKLWRSLERQDARRYMRRFRPWTAAAATAPRD